MKTVGITDKEKQLLLIVLSLGILAAAYFFGFTKLMDQASTIKASNVQDQATVDQLQGMVDKQAETEAQTEEYKKTIKDIVKKYPVNVPQEKSIYLIQEMEDIVGLHVSGINFSMNNLVMNFSGNDAPSGRYDMLGVSFTATYEQFKDLLKHIHDYPDRTTSPSVSVDYDQYTGLLTGNISYKMYFLTSTESEFDDRTYEEVPPTGIESGVDSIFGLLGYVDEVPEDGEGDGQALGRVSYIPEGFLEQETQDQNQSQSQE